MVRARSNKKDTNHIPRPLNSFFLFRQNFNANLTQAKKTKGKKNQRKISGDAKAAWKALPPAEKKLWIDRAAEADAEHKKKYPNYKYRPNTVNTGGVEADDEDSEEEEVTAARDDDDYVPRGTPRRSPRARKAKAKRFRTPEPAMEEGQVPTPIPAPIVPTAFAPMYYHQPPTAFDNYYPQYQDPQQFFPPGMEYGASSQTNLYDSNGYQPPTLIPASSLGPESFTGPAPPNPYY